MAKRLQEWIEQYRHMDWAVLYLRLFVGGLMLFHNVGKMQNYNEIISSYPSLLYINSAAVFVLIAAIEVLFSVLIIMGLWVRMSALILGLGTLMLFAWGGFDVGAEAILLFGIYVFLLISGGGLYAFDLMIDIPKQYKQTI